MAFSLSRPHATAVLLDDDQGSHDVPLYGHLLTGRLGGRS